MVKNFLKVICFDLDNVICKTKNSDYKNSKPINSSIKVINRLYDKGLFIKIFTARFMGRNNDNVNKSIKMGYKLTQNQLKKWKVKYHRLIMGKPSYDLFVDDKNFGFNKNWHKKIESSIKDIEKNHEL